MSTQNDDNIDVTDLSETEQSLLQNLRRNPYFANQIFELTEEFQREVNNGMDADEAETMLIESLQKLGSSMMHQWADKTQLDQIEKLRGEQNLHKHSKKNSDGIPPLER